MEVTQQEIVAAFEEEIKQLSSQNIMLRLVVRKQAEQLVKVAPVTKQEVGSDPIQEQGPESVPVREEA